LFRIADDSMFARFRHETSEPVKPMRRRSYYDGCEDIATWEEKLREESVKPELIYHPSALGNARRGPRLHQSALMKTVKRSDSDQ
jgi:hypothetical protein